MRARDTTTHLVAGGVGGTVGAIVTCPLEVVKTRLQSSASGFGSPGTATSVWRCLRQVWALEGLPGLFRGLGPNLVGVAPSRAIYFWAYSSCKASLNSGRLLGAPDTPAVHVTAAATAGVISSISTNPIWVVKTRLQLDREVRPTSLGSVVRQVYREGGLRAFYLGLTASFYGTSETVVHFVVYEHLRARVAGWLGGEGQDLRHFLGFMACGAASKTGATCLAYPHGEPVSNPTVKPALQRSSGRGCGSAGRSTGRSGRRWCWCTGRRAGRGCTGASPPTSSGRSPTRR